MPGRTFITALLLLSTLVHADPQVESKNWTSEVFVGPQSAQAFPAWLADMKQWRDHERAGLDFSHSVYDLPRLKWTQSNFVQTQVMIHDRFLFADGAYTPETFLSDLKTRYGGVDSVLLWPTYPNLGIDERNQYDLTRDLPGGLDQMKKLVEEFHHQNVRVLLPLNPWDNGTRDEGMPHDAAISQLMAALGADGFNGDTMAAPGQVFLTDGQSLGYDFAIEPEIGLGDDLQSIEWIPLSWAYWMDYTEIPGVDRYKWLEPRHMSHVCRREVQDRSQEMQYLWFNGGGYLSWENIWGIWNGMTQYDAEVLKRISTLQRAFGSILINGEWEPHTPVLQSGIYASRFSTPEATLYTLVNRTQAEVDGAQISLTLQAGQVAYDLWNGEILASPNQSQSMTLSFPIEPRGYGAILVSNPMSAVTLQTLALMHELSKKKLADFSKDWSPLVQKIVEIPLTSSVNQDVSGMVLVPAQPHYQFQVTGVEIEKYPGVDIQYPWENSTRLEHNQDLSIAGFYMDRNLVTNAEFQKFLQATRYRPADAHNFLKDWDTGKIPAGAENRPVTWVSIEDARAYAAWAGKRLPHEWEWQYAAQGTDSRLYPWGNTDDPSFMPAQDTGRTRKLPDPVGAHPQGASPFGVQDMVGDVWQWTDEYRDDHTRAAIVRGGSSYFPQGSQWYFPNTHKLSEHGKYLLMAPSLDRSGTVGFRCVKDLF